MQTTLELNTEKSKRERIEQLIGEYEFVSPYHENKKMLPFTVHGPSYSQKFPLKCTTVEYRGWTRKKHEGDYTIENIEHFISSGFLKKKIK